MAENFDQFYRNQNPDLDQFYDDTLDSADLLPPTRYINKTLISEGGSKKVYRATDSHCCREVAFAYIKDKILSLGDTLDFIREVQLTAALEHPNIISIYNVGIEGTKPWFTMELMSGQTLEDRIAENPSLSERIELFLQTCDAISYAHDHDILHLDLKPANVAISQHGQAILCDWGIATSISSNPTTDLQKDHSAAKHIKGTPGFMAPEQNQPGYIKQPAADIFGLGALLYYILTGTQPFQGSTPDEINTQTKKGKIHQLHCEAIPASLAPVIEKALSPAPAKRYLSAKALQQEIEQYRAGFATQAENASLSTQARLFFQRNQRTCLSVAAALLLLIGLTAYYVHSIKRSEMETRDALTESQAATQRAQRAEQEAEASFQRYKDEQEAKEKTNRDYAALLVLQNRQRLDNFQAGKALSAAKLAVRKAPDSKKAKHQLGFTYFLMQQFGEAHPLLLESNVPKIDDLIEISARYADLERPLTGEEMLEVFQAMNPRRVFLKRYMFQHNAKIKSPAEHSPLVRYFLKTENKLNQIHYSYDAKKRTLDLSNNPELTTLEAKPISAMDGFNIIESLPLKKLILTKTALTPETLPKTIRESKIKVVW